VILKYSLKVPLIGSILFRALISAAIDSDEPFYTISSFSAFSFVCLGGLQLGYELTFSLMLVFFAIASLGDSVRVIVAYREAASLSDVVLTSNMTASHLRGDKMVTTTELAPSNVYEDFGRGGTIVLMVFATQVILISFVAADIYQNRTHTCPDGTAGCPVVGTLGSWGFYVLGIFMACVYLLGPKTNFGQSEQNPAYWLQLLLAAKTLGAQCTWYDAVADKTVVRHLSHSDWRIWTRFFMSFLINGVGFHILVHALPIQVASQSSFIGVVFRAVGMMYLVDLDDTPAQYKFELMEKVEPLDTTTTKPDYEQDKADTTCSPKPMEQPTSMVMLSDAELSAAAQRIVAEALEEARVKLEALARGEVVMTAGSLPARHNSTSMSKLSSRRLMSGALVLASSTAHIVTTGVIESPLNPVVEVSSGDESDGLEEPQKSAASFGAAGTDSNLSTVAELTVEEHDVEEQSGSATLVDSPLSTIAELTVSERDVEEQQDGSRALDNTVLGSPLNAVGELSGDGEMSGNANVDVEEQQQDGGDLQNLA